MRKSITLYCMAALMLGACTILEPADKLQESIPGAETVTVRIASPATRVGFDDNLGKFEWTAGDKIAVHVSATAQIAGSYKTATVAVDPSDNTLGNFSVVLSGGQERDLFAVYPDVSAVSTAAAAAGFKVCLPAEREISGSMADSPVPMVALNATSPLTFQHVGALLRLELKNVPTGTKKIAVSMGKRITGEFAVSGVSDSGLDNPSIVTGDGSDEVVFVLPEALTAYQPTYIINVPIPTGTYPSLRITARDAADEPIHSYYDEVERSFDAGRGRHAEAQLSNLTTPLCLEAAEIASVVISNPLGKTIEISSDAVTWTSFNDASKEIWLGIGDKLYFRGNNAAYSDGTLFTNIRCDGRCYLYGNIMSLIQPVGFDQALTLTANYTFYKLFAFSNILSKVGDELTLPAETLRASCYREMFKDCATLEAAPELPAMSIPESAYRGMFYNCVLLTSTPTQLPATTVGSYCYMEMFAECPSLSDVPDELPAETLTSSCYYGMFKNCKNITKAPIICATAISNGSTASCYNMFFGCTRLSTVSTLKIKTLTQNCYYGMFEGCKSLTTAPSIDGEELASSCYYRMFAECTNLTKAPELSCTTLQKACYGYMFLNCTSLTIAPELNATQAAERCYAYMFSGCESLSKTPTMGLKFTAQSCCNYMFKDCSNITQVMTKLDPTTLSNGCYWGMFSGCSKIEQAPILPALELVNDCYIYMFSGASALKTIHAYFTTIPNSLYLEQWLPQGSEGCNIYLNRAIDWDPARYRSLNGIPTGWNIEYVTVQN